ncbi:TatD family hydrolase [Verrucomicrobiaceae bacterium N1E253]|uniref:TatD family hydrolase n=1 Tax=Oceaniferula marina TaxID=2748318 RepID=A0A851GJ36_9BACT|nr:TatD family hydrolase [Oceaniferula marina]NWK57189.1 TatD family hydrolase [Oceaniferula marina]
MFDSHNHLQSQRFGELRSRVIEEMFQAGVTRAVINGTSPNDWGYVSELSRQHPQQLIPSFGLHPWYVDEAPADWSDQLVRMLDLHPTAGIGECGLDRARHRSHFQLQLSTFTHQLQLAEARNLPLSIHCVRAWGAMVDILESQKLPQRGFLMHSYGGSAELIPRLTKLGAYFSCPLTILHPGKEKSRQIFQQVPADRLLIESDAPDMSPPSIWTSHPLPGGLNHPANLAYAMSGISEFLDTSQCMENFQRFFLG